MHILLTRPEGRAALLMQQLEALGHSVQSIPLIAFEPSPASLFDAARLALTEPLHRFHSLIFVSQSAVQFAMPIIQASLLDGSCPLRYPIFEQQKSGSPPTGSPVSRLLGPVGSMEWIAIGPATAQALHSAGIHPVSIPEPPHETESLLRLASLQSVQDKTIGIVKGVGGRALLEAQLKARGAKVLPLIVYQRTIPDLATTEIQAQWTEQAPDLIISSSLSCLSNIIQSFPKALPMLRQKPIIVVGARMQAFAKEQGFLYPLLATGADDSTIIKVFKAFLRDPVQ